MRKLIAAFVLLASSIALAGSNEGSLRCRQGNDLLAFYIWFGGAADNFAQAYVYTRGRDGKWTRFESFVTPALSPVEIAVSGRKLTITPDLQNDTCLIK